MGFGGVYHNANGTTVTAENITTTGIVSAARFRAGNGTEALPAYSFTDRTDKGLYSSGANDTVRIVTAGSNSTSFLTTGISGLSVDAGGYFTLNNTSAPAAFGANQNDYALNANISALLVSSSVASVDITGIVNSSGNGRIVPIINVGTSNNVVLKHQSTSSSAANRFVLPNATDLTLAPGEAATLFYFTANSRWYVMGVGV